MTVLRREGSPSTVADQRSHGPPPHSVLARPPERALAHPPSPAPERRTAIFPAAAGPSAWSQAACSRPLMFSTAHR